MEFIIVNSLTLFFDELMNHLTNLLFRILIHTNIPT